jgi:hypothetical protein
MLVLLDVLAYIFFLFYHMLFSLYELFILVDIVLF